jgi:hypothetical protein
MPTAVAQNKAALRKPRYAHRMKRFALVVILSALLTGRALAEQPPPGPADSNVGPPPELRQRMDQARDAARTGAMTALSSEHQAKVSAVLSRIKAGQLTDLHDAAQQIDAVLTPKEAQAVLAARDTLMDDMRGSRPGSGGDGEGRDSGPPPGPPPGPGMTSDGPPAEGGRRLAGHAMHNDAGFALLLLNLDREQMRSFLTNSHPRQ